MCVLGRRRERRCCCLLCLWLCASRHATLSRAALLYSNPYPWLVYHSVASTVLSSARSFFELFGIRVYQSGLVAAGMNEGSRVARAWALGGAARRFLIFFPPNLSQILREMFRGKGCVNSHPFFLVECTLSHSTLQQACYASPPARPLYRSFLPPFLSDSPHHSRVFMLAILHEAERERLFALVLGRAPGPLLAPSLPPSLPPHITRL